MPLFIVKLTKGKESFYLEWSGATQRPISKALPLEEFRKYYKKQYGVKSKKDLEERLERVEKSGTSAYDTTVKEILEGNHAGPEESELTPKEILKRYCPRQALQNPIPCTKVTV